MSVLPVYSRKNEGLNKNVTNEDKKTVFSQKSSLIQQKIHINHQFLALNYGVIQVRLMV